MIEVDKSTPIEPVLLDTRSKQKVFRILSSYGWVNDNLPWKEQFQSPNARFFFDRILDEISESRFKTLSLAVPAEYIPYYFANQDLVPSEEINRLHNLIESAKTSEEKKHLFLEINQVLTNEISRHQDEFVKKCGGLAPILDLIVQLCLLPDPVKYKSPIEASGVILRCFPKWQIDNTWLKSAKLALQSIPILAESYPEYVNYESVEAIIQAKDKFTSFLQSIPREVCQTFFLYTNSSTWPRRLEGLAELFSSCGIGGLFSETIDDWLVSDYLYKEAIKKTATLLNLSIESLTITEIEKLLGSIRGAKALCSNLEDQYQNQYLSSSKSKRRGTINYLRGQETPGLFEVRKLMFRSGYGEAESIWLKQRIGLSRFRESPFHPANTLALSPLCGIEVEYPKSRFLNFLSDGDFDFGSLTDGIGIKKGSGGTRMENGYEHTKFDEISPGPCLDPYTLETIVSLYEQADILSFYRNSGLGVHLNYGLNEAVGYDQIVWGMYLGALGYDPGANKSIAAQLSNSARHFINLRIESNNNGFGSYWECKDATASTPDELSTLVIYSASLCRALFNLQKFIPGRKEEFYYSLPYISNNSGSKYEVTLANLYLDYLRGFMSLLDQYKFSYPDRTQGLKVEDIEMLNQIILKVFPNDLSRYDDPKLIDVNPTFLNGVTYPNLISAARALLHQSHEAVESVFVQVENDALDDLTRITKTSNKKQILTMVNKYCVKFAPHLHTASQAEKVEFLSNVAALYKLELPKL